MKPSLNEDENGRSDNGRGLQRISVSIPQETFEMLEELVADGGYDNRSKAVADLITQAAVNLREEHGDKIMAGTITIIYDQSRRGVADRLARTKSLNIREVISSFQVLLFENKMLETILVQGKPPVLKRIKENFASIKGVAFARLTLTQTVIPPLHQPEGGPQLD